MCGAWKNTALSFMVEKIAGEKKKGLEIKAGSDTAWQEVVQAHKHICNSYASFLML